MRITVVKKERYPVIIDTLTARERVGKCVGVIVCGSNIDLATFTRQTAPFRTA